MATVERNPNDFTVSELKGVLRGMGLLTSGIKSELIARIFERDPSGRWMASVQDVMVEEVMESSEDTSLPSARGGDSELLRREMELCRREKELIERELQIIRRENETLRRMRDADGSEVTMQREEAQEPMRPISTQSQVCWVTSRVMAACLKHGRSALNLCEAHTD